MCANDEGAIIWAKQLIDGYDVKLWSGDRFVIKLDHQQKYGQAPTSAGQFKSEHTTTVVKYVGPCA